MTLGAVVRPRTTMVVFIAMWVMGLAALAVAIDFQIRVDRQRQAEVVVGTMQRQAGVLAQVAFTPATTARRASPSVAETELQLAAAKVALSDSIASLGRLDSTSEQARIEMLDRRYFRTIDQMAALVATGQSREAALQFGRETQPTGTYGALLTALHQTSARFSRAAARSRLIGTVGTVAATLLVLLAFSITLYRATRLAREKHQLLERSRIEALTDALTGLPNRRKLFADMESLLGTTPVPEGFALGMFDLDGFKAYNDAFGHPAGDALLTRCGHKLAAAMEGHGSAYRMGGDEFCVIVRGPDAERVLSAAADSLSERGEHFDVQCSRGSVVIGPNEMALEQALLQADQRLYGNKRARTSQGGGEAHVVLLSVLAEHSVSLAVHVGHVGRLAEAVAYKLELSEDDVALTRLTAELHDVGKTAIPDAILNKPGPLDPDEWELMRRHTIIGERILASAPALARIAPLVRSTHERVDGKGYPDGLRADEIPLSSRIVAVVDAYDAMTSNRSYGVERTVEQALSELHACSGNQFDSDVVAAFTAVCRARAGELLAPRARIAA